MSALELLHANAHATGLSPDQHPADQVRARLASRGALPVTRLAEIEHGRRVHVGGIVTHRQRPPTAGGVTFLSLEDETGVINIVVSPGLARKYDTILRASTALLVRGIVESHSGARNVIADKLEPVTVSGASPARSYR